jgi:hypothetical protein
MPIVMWSEGIVAMLGDKMGAESSVRARLAMLVSTKSSVLHVTDFNRFTKNNGHKISKFVIVKAKIFIVFAAVKP